MKRITYTLTILFLIATSYAQEFSSFTAEDFDKDKNYGFLNYVQVSGYTGKHLGSLESLDDMFTNGFYGFGARFGTQSTGRKDWQRLHNYPKYGLGVSFFSLGEADADSLIGAPTALYFFYSAPIARFGGFTFSPDLEVGLSTDFNPYDAETNSTQNYIGATTNLHFNLTFALNYQLSDRFDIGVGLAMLHFSNGRTFTPQRGVNLGGLSFSSSYYFNPVKNYTKLVDPEYQPPIRPEFIVAEKSAFEPHHEFLFFTSVATVQAEPGEFKDEFGVKDTTGAEGPRYFASTTSVDYAYQFARKLKVLVGFDAFYDGSAEYLYKDILPQNTTFADKSFYGAHVGFHYLIERFAFVFNYGRYVYKPFEKRGNWYMRVGGRMGITESIDAHIALKTRDGGIADWIEWGVSYKIKVKKK
ncbi:MAG: acyloxyacyl hydrolase [Draconibacterium sp.]|nr:acyloxyacyl hydrolase [Draconibacterium sp.]